MKIKLLNGILLKIPPMKLPSKTKIFLLFLGDVVALYLSLTLDLASRYGGSFVYQLTENHLTPFSLIFILWILVFYISGLYDLKRLRNNIEFLKTLWLVIVINAGITIALFYLIPFFGIAPKTNLFIFLIFFAVIETYWRRSFNTRASFRDGLNSVLLLGEGKIMNEIFTIVKENPQFGYEVKAWLKKGLADPEIGAMGLLVRDQKVNLIIIPRKLKNDLKLARSFYELVTSGVQVSDAAKFYELVFQKTPLSDLEENWFIEDLAEHKKFYDDLKRGGSFLVAFGLGIITLPLTIFIALIIEITSPGPVIYRQTRVGQKNRPFTLYKFRTMRVDAERDGAKWSGKNDNRVTMVGKILRYSHLDELPQLLNILKGEVSFVGPRPERPEFTKMLENKLPFYKIRHIIKPGITGWAQINYRYGSSVDDAYEKLQYDIYYLKNRSLILDVAIIAKTIKSFFVNNK